MGGEQRFNLPPQFVVRAAPDLEEMCALAGAVLQRGVIQPLDFAPPLRCHRWESRLRANSSVPDPRLGLIDANAVHALHRAKAEPCCGFVFDVAVRDPLTFGNVLLLLMT